MRKILRYAIIISIILGLFPAWVVINHIRGDMALREHTASNIVPGIKNGFRRFFRQQQNNPLESEVDVIQLSLSEKVIDSINSEITNRQYLLNNGAVLIGSNRWAYHKATAIINGDTLKLDLRIRGDMPSNYNRGIEHASYKFNIKNNKTLKGASKLSIVRPFLENGVYGYLYYKYLLKQGIPGSDIHLVRVELNGKDIGLFFLQEWFEAHMLEVAGIDNGIIFKMKNDCASSNGNYNQNKIPSLQSYQENKLLKTSDGRNTYNNAITAYYDYKHLSRPSSATFDFDKMGEFIALSDLFTSHHSMFCQNIKLVWNDATKRFGPVAWDPSCFNRMNNKLPVRSGHNYFFGDLLDMPQSFPFYNDFSRDSSFCASYCQHLYDLIQSKDILSFIELHNDLFLAMDREFFISDGLMEFSPKYLKNNLTSINDFFGAENRFDALINQNGLTIHSNSYLPLTIEIQDHLTLLLPPKSTVHQPAFNPSLKRKKLNFISYPVGLNHDSLVQTECVPILL